MPPKKYAAENFYRRKKEGGNKIQLHINSGAGEQAAALNRRLRLFHEAKPYAAVAELSSSGLPGEAMSCTSGARSIRCTTQRDPPSGSRGEAMSCRSGAQALPLQNPTGCPSDSHGEAVSTASGARLSLCEIQRDGFPSHSPGEAVVVRSGTKGREAAKICRPKKYGLGPTS